MKSDKLTYDRVKLFPEKPKVSSNGYCGTDLYIDKSGNATFLGNVTLNPK